MCQSCTELLREVEDLETLTHKVSVQADACRAQLGQLKLRMAHAGLVADESGSLSHPPEPEAG